ETVLTCLMHSGELDDPLLQFADRLDAGKLDGPHETVNLAPLFSCQGAALDAAAADGSARSANLEAGVGMAAQAGWKAVLPEPCFRSGILLLQATRPATRGLAPAELRAAFYTEGVALSTYDNGLVRLSLPATLQQDDELTVLRQALRRTG